MHTLHSGGRRGQGVYLQALQFVLPPPPDAPEVGDGEQVDGGIALGEGKRKDSNVRSVPEQVHFFCFFSESESF